MTYFILMVRQTGLSKISGGSCITVDGDGVVVSPLEEFGGASQEDLETLDARIAALPASTTVVTWLGHMWLHLIGPAAQARYADQVDLAAVFICRNRHHVGLAAFEDVESARTADAVATLVRKILVHGRVLWRTDGGGGRLNAFWVPDFFMPLHKLTMRSPPEWITSPARIEMASF